MTKPTPPKAPPPQADPDALPQAGGSYTRQPDGTLAPSQPAQPAQPEQPAQPAQATAPATQE